MPRKKVGDFTATLKKTRGEPRSLELPVDLEAGERSVRAAELASLVGEEQRQAADLEQYLETAKARRKDLEAELAGVRLQVRAIATVVREGREARPVRVVDENDYTAGAVYVVRLDTGEVVSTRSMSEAERQVALFPGPTES